MPGCGRFCQYNFANVKKAFRRYQSCDVGFDDGHADGGSDGGVDGVSAELKHLVSML